MKHTITIGWLYPSLMSTYGDRGNIICLQKRCAWREIEVSVVPIDSATSAAQLASVDCIFGGGSQDRQQEIVMRDLVNKKNWLIEKVESGAPALFVCGAPQLMGTYYEPAEGTRIEGLGLFDMTSVHPGNHVPRCIGNIVAEVQWPNLKPSVKPWLDHSRESGNLRLDPRLRGDEKRFIVGFENHGGRTHLGPGVKPFARVVKGYGNNGTDGTEGVVYKNAIGCYFHGPLLPKNPHIADFIIQRTLEVKYQTQIVLKKLDDSLEWKAHEYMLSRLGVK